MNDLERSCIEQQCARLINGFALRIDAYDHPGVLDLWTEDAVWETWKGPRRGRAEMAEYLAAKDTTPVARHVITNIQIDVSDDFNASGTAYWTYYEGRAPAGGGAAPFDGPRAIGQYFKKFRRTAKGWRILHSRTVFVFTRS